MYLGDVNCCDHCGNDFQQKYVEMPINGYVDKEHSYRPDFLLLLHCISEQLTHEHPAKEQQPN